MESFQLPSAAGINHSFVDHPHPDKKTPLTNVVRIRPRNRTSSHEEKGESGTEEFLLTSRKNVRAPCAHSKAYSLHERGIPRARCEVTSETFPHLMGMTPSVARFTPT